MAWIESHDDIGDHTKTQALCHALNISVPTAVGHLHLLWHYTLRVAWQTGDLSGHFPQAIARACYWDGSPEEFIKALQFSNLIDGMKVHDWETYARELIYQRTYNKTKRLTAVKQVKNYCNTAKSSPLPYPTLPNQKNPAKNAATLKQIDEAKQIDLKDINIKGQSEGVKHKVFNKLVDIFRSRGWKTEPEYLKNIFRQICSEIAGYEPKEFFPYFMKVSTNYINKNSELLAADAKMDLGKNKKLGMTPIGMVAV